jgi:uncharacterized membrane protein (UPF0127 family)
MLRRVALGIAVALATLADTPAPTASPNYAALSCANAALPPQILDGEAARTAIATLPIIDVTGPTVKLHLALAADYQTREIGLMCVTRLRPHAGMIFKFDQSADWDFWMKNTLIALDMVWVEADGTVSSVAANVPASTLTTPDEKIARRHGHGRYVIELPPGEAALDGIVKGAKLTIGEMRSPK